MSSAFYYLFAAIVFLIPTSLVAAELAAMFQDKQGGVFRWVGEAVRMMPPLAPSFVTASSVVGVEACPMLTTSNPMPISVPHTTFLTISPEMRASRPTTMVLLFTVVVRRIHAANADVYFTMSNGFSVSPTWPPIVPRMPEID